MPDLSGLMYSTHIDSPDTERGRDIAVHDFSAYITGDAESDAFPTTPGMVQPSKNGAPADGFVTRLSPDGSSLVFSTFIGGDNLDTPLGIDVDLRGNAYVTGNFTGFNVPTTPGAFLTERRDNDGGVVMKLSPDGTSLLYSTYVSNDGADRPHSIRVDSQGAAHIAGVTTNRTFEVTEDALQPANLNLSTMAYYTVLSSDGSRQLYSSYHGGDELDAVGEFQSSFVFGDVLDEHNCQAVFVGRTQSSSFPLQNAFQPASGGGDWDAFVSKVDPFTADGEPHIGCNGAVLATGTPVRDRLARRSIGTVFGTDFSMQTVLSAEVGDDGLVTTDLGSTCVEIAGRRGAEFAVLSNQVNFMVPPGRAAGLAGAACRPELRRFKRGSLRAATCLHRARHAGVLQFRQQHGRREPDRRGRQRNLRSDRSGRPVWGRTAAGAGSRDGSRAARTDHRRLSDGTRRNQSAFGERADPGRSVQRDG